MMHNDDEYGSTMAWSGHEAGLPEPEHVDAAGAEASAARRLFVLLLIGVAVAATTLLKVGPLVWPVAASPLAITAGHDQNARYSIPAMNGVAPPRLRAVAARGRVEPASGVTRVAGPTHIASVVAELRVVEGTWVGANQILAVLEGTPAQEAQVARLDAEARHAATDLRRVAQLFARGITSAAERDTAQLRLDVARAELARARAILDTLHVRAPITGRVLAVHAHRGERIGPDGIAELADTTRMEVVAEVYETDIGAVRVGDPVQVTGPALPGTLSGEVARIGLALRKLSVLDVDPTAATDARVIEVRIRLDDSATVAALTNLQVDVRIDA